MGEFKSPLQFKSSEQLLLDGNAHLLREGRSYYIDVVCPVEHEPLRDLESIRGLKRVCRYPSFWSNAGLWLGCALKSSHYSALIMFTFPAVFALIGSLHQDFRYKRSGALTSEIEQHSCLFPFVALCQGRQSWRALWDEIKYPHFVIGA